MNEHTHKILHNHAMVCKILYNSSTTKICKDSELSHKTKIFNRYARKIGRITRRMHGIEIASNTHEIEKNVRMEFVRF